MVDDEIHHEFHVTLMETGYELVNVFQSAVAWINVFVVGDVVAHVDLG